MFSDTPSRSTWDDDEDDGVVRPSSWDFPTPNPHSSTSRSKKDYSERRSESRHREDSRRSHYSERRTDRDRDRNRDRDRTGER